MWTAPTATATAIAPRPAVAAAPPWAAVAARRQAVATIATTAVTTAATTVITAAAAAADLRRRPEWLRGEGCDGWYQKAFRMDLYDGTKSVCKEHGADRIRELKCA